MATNTGKILLAVATGAALGATLGMLFAPEKGSKTRRRLTGGVAKTADDYIDDLVSEGKKTWKKAQNEGEDMSDDIEGYLAHIAKEGKKSWRQFQANAEDDAGAADDPRRGPRRLEEDRRAPTAPRGRANRRRARRVGTQRQARRGSRLPDPFRRPDRAGHAHLFRHRGHSAPLVAGRPHAGRRGRAALR